MPSHRYSPRGVAHTVIWHVRPQGLEQLGGFQKVNLFLFVGFYLFYVLMSLILLLNLLIAMLSHTFSAVRPHPVPPQLQCTQEVQ